ncbi:MAG: sulfotransferase, partial [Gammaproteobacteria bacterium]
VSDKMPGNFIHIGAISVLFPDATIIHCRRDAMDTGLSCFRNHFVSDQLGFTCDLTDLGRYYNRYVDLMAHWHEASTARIHDIQYESLVSDPAGQIRRLLEYCDLPYEAGCLSFHENRRAVRTASAVQVRRPIYRDSVQGWKHYEKQLRPLRAALEGRRGRIGSRISGVIARFRGRSA